MHVRDHWKVYRAVRKTGHARWRAARCCLDVRRGSWSARDAGEMGAQLALMAEALRESDPASRPSSLA